MHAVVDHPAYNVAQLAPGPHNIPMGLTAYASNMMRGNYDDAKFAAVGSIPGAKIAHMVPRVLPNLTRGSMTANAMRASTLANIHDLVD